MMSIAPARRRDLSAEHIYTCSDLITWAKRPSVLCQNPRICLHAQFAIRRLQAVTLKRAGSAATCQISRELLVKDQGLQLGC